MDVCLCGLVSKTTRPDTNISGGALATSDEFEYFYSIDKTNFNFLIKRNETKEPQRGD